MTVKFIDFSDLEQVLDEIIDKELERQAKEKQQRCSEKTQTQQHKKKPKRDIVDKINLAVYIAHPFSGDEEENIKRSETLTAELVKSFPDITFLNPLSTFKYLKEANLSYYDCMKHCIFWLHRCDGVLMAPGWEMSKGCQIEHKEAIRYWMPVWDSISQFADAMYHRNADI